MSKPATSFQSLYEKTVKHPLKFIKGTCRFHFNIEAWKPYLLPEDTKIFIEKHRPVISFLSEDEQFFESVEITPNVFAQVTQGADTLYYLHISHMNMSGDTLSITIVTGKQYPYYGEIGDFIARAPL